MKRFLCIALLAVGCSSMPTAPTETTATAGIQNWIPGIFADLYETVDANVGLDYGFGAHAKATELARVGVFDYSDFSVLGFDKEIFHGQWNFPKMDQPGSVWDLSATLGVGLGASATVHTWEVLDLISSIIGFGYWSLDED